jgi:hypothetical protein
MRLLLTSAGVRNDDETTIRVTVDVVSEGNWTLL